MHIKEETIARLKQFDTGDKFSSLSVLPKASVLIPLFVKNGELCTLMTLRSQEVTPAVVRLNCLYYLTQLLTDLCVSAAEEKCW